VVLTWKIFETRLIWGLNLPGPPWANSMACCGRDLNTVYCWLEYLSLSIVATTTKLAYWIMCNSMVMGKCLILLTNFWWEFYKILEIVKYVDEEFWLKYCCFPIHTSYKSNRGNFMTGVTKQFLEKFFPSTHGNVKYVYNNFVKHRIGLFHSQNLPFLLMLERRENINVSITIKPASSLYINWGLTTVASYFLMNWLKSSRNRHIIQHENSNISVPCLSKMHI